MDCLEQFLSNVETRNRPMYEQLYRSQKFSLLRRMIKNSNPELLEMLSTLEIMNGKFQQKPVSPPSATNDESRDRVTPRKIEESSRQITLDLMEDCVNNATTYPDTVQQSPVSAPRASNDESRDPITPTGRSPAQECEIVVELPVVPNETKEAVGAGVNDVQLKLACEPSPPEPTMNIGSINREVLSDAIEEPPSTHNSIIPQSSIDSEWEVLVNEEDIPDLSAN